MGKLKDLCLNWQEMYDCGIPMEYTIDKFNWFDAKEPPRFDDGKWYREKKIPLEEHQSNDDYLPK